MAFCSRALCRAILLGLGLAFTATGAAAQTVRPPIESFFENPAFGGAMLSPSGRYLAALAAKGGYDALTVIDLEQNRAKIVASFTDADVGKFQWVNDERLVFSLTQKDEAQGDIRQGQGLFAINRDGSEYRQLADRRGKRFVDDASGLIHKKLLPWHTFLMDQTGSQDSEFIHVISAKYTDDGDFEYLDLLRLNTLTGRSQAVARPGPVRRWLLDHKGAPRLAVSIAGKERTMHYNDPASGQWRQLARFDTYMAGPDHFDPIGFGPDGTLYISAMAGGDTETLRTFDFASGKVSKQALVETPGYDFSGQLVSNRDKILGVRLTTDAQGHAWFDPAMQALQQSIDKVLKGSVNLISVPAQADSAYVLVASYADVMPTNYALYNKKTGTFSPIGSTHPKIVIGQMGRQEPVRYKARDGLEIPGLLTLPAGGVRKNLPLVVLVHGGPWMRGASWGWNSDSQFLASRGYAVLEPEFRGSTGFGSKHFRAGLKQWGLAMQNDIADGARWAIAQGYADPKRICIAGASYGGYSTLMGLVNDPDLFKCGVNWIGVTDIDLMYTDAGLSRSDLTEDVKQYGLPNLIGDQQADAAQLKATSPIQQAARITQPLLLAYGGADRRVPLFHGQKFYEAVRRTNRKVEWVVYQEEGHGWHLPKNRIDFWGRVEKFLDTNIGSAAPAP